MARRLIINADDCNLTRGVTAAILDAHDHGIVTSTTYLVNLPSDERLVRELKKRRTLGIGLHLNVTLGRPVSAGLCHREPRAAGRGDLRSGDCFARPPKFTAGKPAMTKKYPPHFDELVREYESQIRLFQKIFRRTPTHLDTHHQLHDEPYFFSVLAEVAKKYKLPIRRSRCMCRVPSSERREINSVLGAWCSAPQTTDYLFGSLDPRCHWTEDRLAAILENLPEGTSEIMCHPGKNDRDLMAISSFSSGREVEWRLLRSPALPKRLQKLGIQLVHYGV